MTEPYELTLAEASAAIRSRELSPVELTESALARVAAIDGKIGAFRTVTAEAALASAAAAEREIAAGSYRGPLHGIPLGMKDLYDTAGVPNEGSSAALAGSVAATDSAAMAALGAAGMILIGKTETHEFAFGGITPTTRNPWHLDHIPGGSSGGSGAAVAAGMCLVAMGSDTGGSIRIPAACCGTVGIKPTYGRASRRGVLSLSWSLDHVGPLTRNVLDAALVLGAIAGYDRADPATVDVPVPDYAAGLGAGVAGLRVGVPTTYFFDDADPVLAAAVRGAAATLEGLGAHLVEVDPPMTEAMLPALWSICLPEASAYHQTLFRQRGADYTEQVRGMIEVGEFVMATDYIRALRVRTLIQRAWAEMFTGIDVLLAPTLPGPPPRIGQDVRDLPGGGTETVMRMLVRLCGPANLTGLPSVAVPCGLSAAGLPLGMQIMGRPFDEATILRVAAAWEGASETVGLLAPV
jgi:aspartyl-tRNA(Asn)/glutamyl-tRNA(Gln) amidotransferase subunit A